MSNEHFVWLCGRAGYKWLVSNVFLRAVECVGHLLGASVVAVLSFALTLDGAARAGLREALQSEAFVQQNIVSIAAQLGVSACIWALMVIGFLYVRESLRREPNQVVARARGSVMVETLIALPVMLLLIFGLTQLTLNSTTGLLTSLASFQAGRTVWLWHPETHRDHGRNGGVTSDNIEERARIAAASVLAPVAPANYSHDCNGTSDMFDAKLEAFVASSGAAGFVGDFVSQAFPGAPNFTGMGAQAIKFYAEMQRKGSGGNLSMARAFDSHALSVRGPLKFYYAYCSTGVTYTQSGNYLKATVVFRHKQVVPLVGRIFGEQTRSWRGAEYHSTVQRSFQMPAQRHPNPLVPESLEAIFSGDNPLSQ